jgi:hypothetical protein
MVAWLLHHYCHSRNERGLSSWDLFYLRDQSRRKVDFLLVKDNQPFLLIEAKMNSLQFGSASRYYQMRLKIPLIQIVRPPNITITRPEGLVLSIHKLASLIE